MCELNVELLVRHVASIPTVENAWARGQPLRIHGWVYGVDDQFGTAEAARHIAQSVRAAKLLIYPSGGHVWAGHDQEMFAAIDAFLLGD